MSFDATDLLSFALLACLASFGLAACGNVSTSSSFHCCLNGEYYECDDQEELDTCFSTGENQCDRTPSKDHEC